MTAPLSAMKYRYLGNTGLLVSRFSFGCMSFDGVKCDEDEAYAIMTKAHESGVNFFDNAEGYALGKAENIMGKCIRRGIENGLWAREDLVISTKIFFGPRTPPVPNSMKLSRKHVIEGVKNSLKNTGLDYVDLVFCHRQDVNTPIEETVRAMNYVIDQGWAFYWGTSEWSSHAISEACEIADRLGLIRPVMEQPEYHIFQRNRVEYDYLDLYKKYKYGLTTYSPLFGGVLAGKYNDGIPQGSRLDRMPILRNRVGDLDARLKTMQTLEAIAQEIGASLAQFSIAWCVINKNVSTVMLGASSVRQLEENLKAISIVDKITPEIMARVEEIVQFQPTLDSDNNLQLVDALCPTFT